jgi:hypothetical protein
MDPADGLQDVLEIHKMIHVQPKEGNKFTTVKKCNVGSAHKRRNDISSLLRVRVVGRHFVKLSVSANSMRRKINKTDTQTFNFIPD